LEQDNDRKDAICVIVPIIVLTFSQLLKVLGEMPDNFIVVRANRSPELFLFDQNLGLGWVAQRDHRFTEVVPLDRVDFVRGFEGPDAPHFESWLTWLVWPCNAWIFYT